MRRFLYCKIIASQWWNNDGFEYGACEKAAHPKCFVFVPNADTMHHVKSELHHAKRQLDDDDDLTDDGRKSEDMMGHHAHAHAQQQQQHAQQHAQQQHAQQQHAQQQHVQQHAMHHHQMLGYAMKDEMKPGASECGVPIPATKPKIWSLADTAACKTPPPTVAQHAWPGSYHHHQQGGMGMGGMGGMNAFAAPPGHGRYGGGGGGFLGGGGGIYHGQGNGQTAGFSEVQTDTPPQTPPSMKLPSVASGLVAAAPPFAPTAGSSCGSTAAAAYNRHEYNSHHHHHADAAFKPFYKRFVFAYHPGFVYTQIVDPIKFGFVKKNWLCKKYIRIVDFQNQIDLINALECKITSFYLIMNNYDIMF